jgi:protein-disulfide isomerase
VRITTFFLALLVGLVYLVGCTSKDQLKSVLEKNPEIIFNAIEKNPAKFMESVEKASMAARKDMQAKQEEDQKKQLEEEFKNPKKPEITADHPIRGNAKAPILVVEYSDFQCPYCKRGYTTVEELRKKYGEKVAFVFKNLPLDFHPLAMPAAKRFTALSLQSSDLAYKFHDYVFENQDKLGSGGEKFLDEAAKKVGADLAKMKKDLSSDKVTKLIEADKAEAAKFGIQGTPGFIVAGVALKGAYPLPSFDQIIERRLKESGSN